MINYPIILLPPLSSVTLRNITYLSGVQHHVLLQNLTPGQQYYYQVQNN